MLGNLGIVCQTGSTGGVRYAVMLAMAIRRVAPDIAVTLHHGRGVLADGPRRELLAAGVELHRLGMPPRARTPKFFRPKAYLRHPAIDRRIHAVRVACITMLDRWRRARLVEALRRHDLVHFAWPYELDPPPLPCPASFIPHDFIHSHEFGVPIYDHVAWTSARVVLGRWIEKATPIVSSDFVAAELTRVFPHYSGPLEIIYLSSLHARPRADDDDDRAAATCRRLGLPDRFILCPNNVMPHKNLAVLIAALWHLRQAGEDVRLVATGPGTQGIRARVNCPLYGDRVDAGEEWDILGVGLVEEGDLLNLMRRAALVVNPSLCEAGSGSSLDAWGCGAPVALADIPSFRDQVRSLGTRAKFFDPRDPRDAARVIGGMLHDPATIAADAAASCAAIDRYDWDEVARRYVAVFERIAAEAAGGPEATRPEWPRPRTPVTEPPSEARQQPCPPSPPGKRHAVRP